ncbi:MAG: hypothetical protein SF028_00855 [Candidatus Sumerlaeia bacterium]|nr:hypothetical protein [Candidatus Sumerlaeia bacterium]
MTRFAAIAALCALATACDQARDEYTYTLPSPPPTMPPPEQQPGALPAQPPAGSPPQAGAAVLPPAEPFDFTSQKPGSPDLMRPVELAGYRFAVPAAWSETTAGRPMRLAEFKAGAKHAIPTEIVVFHFGPGQGGSAEENAARWLGQVQPDEDSTPQEYLTGNVGPLRLTMVGASGTYTAAQMGQATSAPQAMPGFGLMGLVVEGGPEGSLFIRMTGPREVVREESLPFVWMAGSFSPADGGAIPAGEGGEQLDVAGLSFALPREWRSVPPAGAMRAAQLEIPSGGETLEAVFFHFGPGQGGGAEANIQRWLGQMSMPADIAPLTSKAQVGALTIHEVIAEGDWSGGMAPGGVPASPQKDVRLHGFVVEGGPEGTVFIRVVGPLRAARPVEEALRAFVASAGG